MSDASPPSPSSAGLWLDAGVFAVAIALLFVFEQDITWLSLDEASGISVLLSIYAVVRTGGRVPYGPLSASSVYMVALCVFHFGFTATLFFGIEPSEHVLEATAGWVDSEEALDALFLSLIGTAAAGLGTTLAALLGTLPVPKLPQGEKEDLALARIGAFLTITMVLAWIGILFSRGGFGIFVSSYGNLLELTEGSRIAPVFLLLTIGIPILASTKRRWFHAYAGLAILVFCLLALSVGARGQALLPMAVVIVVLAKRGLRIQLRSILVGGVILLALVSFLRDLRTVGVARAGDASELAPNPVEGLMEMGTSIRPVVEVVRWHEEGDDFILGDSYWAPIDRPLRRILPWRTRIPAEQDMRIMNVLVIERGAGAIGFSPIAEAYRNFGPYGVVAVMWLTGILIGLLDKLPDDGAWPAVVGVVFMPLLSQVRNSFQHVPFSASVGLIIVLGTVFLLGRRRGAHVHSANHQSAGRNSAR